MNSTHQSKLPSFPLVVLVLALGVSAAAQQPATPGQASATARVSTGEHKKVEGVITGRKGDRLTLKLASSRIPRGQTQRFDTGSGKEEQYLPQRTQISGRPTDAWIGSTSGRARRQ